MKTYLELVNLVLVQMREEDTSSVAADEYTRLIGDFVNKAKRQVEDSYDWSALLTDLEVDTVIGQSKYSLTNSQNRVKIDVIVNSTGRRVLREGSRRFITTEYALGNVPNAAVERWANDGVDASGDAQIVVFPNPSTVDTLKITAWQRTPDFTADTDELVIPFAPVVDLALAFAVRERGEVQGQTAAEYFELAKRSLSDEIAYDSARNDSEDDWYSV